MVAEMKTLGSRIRGWFSRARVDQDFERELSAHLEMLTQQNIQQGMAPEEAQRAARMRLGGLTQLKETNRELRGLPMLETFLQDVRYSLRMLRKNPGFTAVSVLTLAIGIGATSAVFTVINAVILQPLPYPESGRLVSAFETNAAYDRPGCSGCIRFSPGNYLDLRDQNTVFAQVGAFTTTNYNLADDGAPERVDAGLASASLFTSLGIRPALGRVFVSSDDSSNADRVALLSYEVWRERFGGNPNAIGKSVRLDDRIHTIVGVLPAGFNILGETAEVWLPLERKTSPEDMRWRESYYLEVIGRLKPGVTLDQAKQDVDQIVQGIRRAYPGGLGQGGTAVPLLDSVLASTRRPLFIFFGAAGFILLIACANITNLNLSRAAARKQEIALRMTLGATRKRLIRQLITESLVLALTGAAFGLAFAKWGVAALLVAAKNEIPRAQSIQLDFHVFAFAMLAATAAGIVVGMLPALSLSQVDLQSTLKTGGRSGFSAPGARRIRNTLVISEIAIALVLMIGAGLMIESFHRVLAVDPGFNPSGLVTMRVSLSRNCYSAIDKQTQFFRQVLDRARNIPGVESLGAVDGLPFSAGGFDNEISIDGRPEISPDHPLIVEIRRADPGYFRTMEMTLIQGRDFNNMDRLDSLPVTVISQSMARRYWPNESPIGKRVIIHFGTPQGIRAEVIGVVSDVRAGLEENPKEYIYLPYPQGVDLTEMYLVLRSRARLSTDGTNVIANEVRDAVGLVDPEQPVYRVRRMEEILSESLATRSFQTILLASLAALAVCLAAIGLYGVLAHSVQMRTKEIGIRAALGASRAQVFGMVLREALGMTILGLIAGLVGAAALTRVLATLLYGVSSTDPLTLLVVCCALLLVALASVCIPARRAMRVDPMVALREE
jgi:predicted permease